MNNCTNKIFLSILHTPKHQNSSHSQTGEMEVNNPLFGGHIEAEPDIEATTGEAKSSSKSPEHSK